jgi:hypothetical protein
MNDRWNWKNFQLPEYHLAFLVIGLIIHRFKPTIFLRNRSFGKLLFFYFGYCWTINYWLGCS